MKKRDTKHLRLKGNTYQLQLWVPTALKHHPKFCGRKVYIQSLHTGDLRTAKLRRDQLLSEIDLLLEGSKAATFRAQVDELRESNRQFLKDNPHLADEGEDILFHAYESIEREALRRGIKQDSKGHLIAPLPENLQLKLDALHHVSQPDDSPTPSAYGDTLKDIAKKTKEHKRQLGKREKTLGKYDRSVAAFLGHLGVRDIPIAKIRRRQVVEFSRAMQGQYSGSTVSNFLSFLSEIWRYARDLELLEGDNPFLGHKIKDDGASYLPWANDQIKDLYQLLPEEDRLPFKIGVYTGARLDEIMTLRPEDIKEVDTDQGKKVLCFHFKPEGDGKTKHSTRLVPVHKALTKDVKKFTSFESTSNAYTKRFGRVKAGYLGESNSRRYAFHSLRHTLSTALHRAGYDEVFISFITGHSNGGRTEAARTYIHGPLIRQMKQAIEKLPVIV